MTLLKRDSYRPKETLLLMLLHLLALSLFLLLLSLLSFPSFFHFEEEGTMIHSKTSRPDSHKLAVQLLCRNSKADYFTSGAAHFASGHFCSIRKVQPQRRA